MDAVTQVPHPANEPVLDYAPGSPERADLEVALAALGGERRDLPHTIDGRRVMGGGKRFDVRQPHARRKVLGALKDATVADARSAVEAAKAAAPGWRALSFDDRAAVLLKAAELLSGPWRPPSTPRRCSGRARPRYQAEIDAACELIDFWRFNVHFARQILADQPLANAKGIWNRTDHRPLEGFVYAITPFNFTAIAGNLPDRPRADGQHRGVEALTDAEPGRALHDGAARGGRPAARRHQPRERRRPQGLQGRARRPRPGRHPLHRVHADVPAPVAHGGPEPRRPTAATRGWSARPAARTSSSPTRPPTPTCSGPP